MILTIVENLNAIQDEGASMAAKRPYRLPEQEDEVKGELSYREISENQLKEVLNKHRQWLTSKGKEGGKANLVDVNLQQVNLSKANFQEADLTGANLQEATLTGANFKEAQLVFANLKGAVMPQTNLQKANLIEANLQGVLLFGADLQEADLLHANLRGVYLNEANLRAVCLNEANLEGANLRHANLERTSLIDVNLDQTVLFDTTFTEANLQNAKLREVKGLLASQLAGCNVSSAQLPDDIKKFEGLEQADRISQRAQKLFLSILLGCVYCFLTIATTTDLALILNTGSSPLPIIETKVPLAHFYWAAPCILLGLYLWFHFYLQRLWEELAQLPAVFPDGRGLDEKVYPWLISGMVRSHVRLLRERRPAFSSMQNALSILLAWWLVPMTFFVFWLRYLPAHEWTGTGLHIGILAVSITGAFLFYRIAAKTLRGERIPVLSWRESLRDVATYQRKSLAVGILGLCIIVFLKISTWSIDGIRPDFNNFHTAKDLTIPRNGFGLSWDDGRILIPRLFHLLGYRTYANLEEQDISTKPENWTGNDDEEKRKAEIALVMGADLRGKNLNYALMSNSFAVKARFDYTQLEGADLYNANLNRAALIRANLQKARLVAANLQEANLERANLQSALLERANLGKTHLFDTNLQNASLQMANFQEASLVRTNLKQASLYSANLQEVKVIKANLKEANLINANLQHASLQGANLQGARLITANLKEASLVGVNLKEADLSFAILEETVLLNVDLRNAVKFTQAQLNLSCINSQTKVPDSLIPPTPCKLKKTPALKSSNQTQRSILRAPQETVSKIE